MAILIRRLAAALLGLAMLATPAFAVFGGKPVAPSDLPAKALAAVLYRTADGAHLCTALALAPRLMLTAAHCTDGGASATRLIFATTLVDVPPSQLRDVAAIARAPRTTGAKGSFAYDNPDDLALLVLASDVPKGTVFASLGQGDGTGTVRIAGYGATSDLRGVVGNGQRGFDGILHLAVTTLTTRGPALVADQSGAAGMCTGDSGGPAFTVAGRTLRVAGVLIGVSAPRSASDFCRGSAHFASIDRWRDWIVATARRLGQPLR